MAAKRTRTWQATFIANITKGSYSTTELLLKVKFSQTDNTTTIEDIKASAGLSPENKSRAVFWPYPFIFCAIPEWQGKA